MNKPFATVLVGLGKIGASYADDSVMNASVPYSTHAQVLVDHDDFNWAAAVDSSLPACETARKRWPVREIVTSVTDLDCREAIEVAVLATPPGGRKDIIENLPNLKAVLVEKPLGITMEQINDFVSLCKLRNILIQVNLNRRADKVMRWLAVEGLYAEIGTVQAAFGVYGNGLINNATHMIDLVRMLLGEVKMVQALTESFSFAEGPLQGDLNFAFNLYMENGLTLSMQPLRFSNYRECSLDFWGEKGRMQIVQEGLSIIKYPIGDCRSCSGVKEINHDIPASSATGYGQSLYDMYTNLSDSLQGVSSLWSSADSALKTGLVVEMLFESKRLDGEIVEL